jgi:twitching motility protein PilT
MDDALFKLWKAEVVTVEDILAKAQNPDDLAKKIVNAKRMMADEVEDDDEEDEDGMG